MARKTPISELAGSHERVVDRHAFIAATSAAVVGLATRDAIAQPVTTLRMASNAADDVTPVLWAQHQNDFAKAGLNISLTRMNSGASVTAAVIGGALEIGKSSVMPLITAHSRNLPISIVAPGELWLTAAPITGLIVAKTSPIVTAKDLSGKTLATSALRDVSWLATHAWLDQRGGDSQTVKFVEIPPSAMVEALIDGRVDAATITNPNYAAALSSGKVKVIGYPSDGIAKRFLLTAWFATNEFISKNGSTIARFEQIVERSAAYTNAHPNETIAMIAGFSGIEPAALAHMTRGVCGTRLQVAEIQPVIDAAVKYQLIDRRLDAQDLVAKLT